ncbi:MAG: glycosyltransferase [Pirellulaceae bacterium]|nr:glycosyltransferase [Pirellulaceae bacterium]
MPPEIEISIVMPAHHEGAILHRSMRSAEAAMDDAQRAGLACELIVVLDRADEVTRGFLQRLPSRRRRVIEANCGDPGMARNHGVAAARGRYIAFLDADDLFGENWLTAAWRQSQQQPHEPVILHAEYNVVFDAENCFAQYRSSTQADFSPLNLVGCNPWTIMLFFPRALFEARQFVFISRSSSRSENLGYAFEDWHWIAEQLALGVPVQIVRGTCNFIRRKIRDSILAIDASGSKLLPPTMLLQPELYGPRGNCLAPAEARFVSAAPDGSAVAAALSFRVPVEQAVVTPKPSGKLWKSVQKRWSKIKQKLNKLHGKISRRWQPGNLRNPTKASAPPWMWEITAAAHRIEPRVFPSEERFEQFGDWTRMAPLQSAAYYECCQYIRKKPTHVLLAPWLKTGGSDLETLNYARAIVEASTDNHVLVIATEDADSPWAERLPPPADFMPLGNHVRNCLPAEWRHLLGTLLVQAGPRVIHNMNSALGYEVFAASGAALRNQSRLFASVFCEEILPDGRIAGYAFKEVPDCFEHLEAVFADNRRILDVLQGYFGFPAERLFTHYQPIEPAETILPRQDATLEVLWAGRLDRQKRPDLLAKIAAMMLGERIQFTVYGSAMLGGDPAVRELANLSNVRMRGSFSSFAELPHADFDLLLHTAQWEGLPNVLLEALARGLPVMAADVGGVGELVVNGHTGVLVSPFDDVDGYCDALRRLAADRGSLTRLARAGADCLRIRHHRDAFQAMLALVPGYLSAEEGNSSSLESTTTAAACRLVA